MKKPLRRRRYTAPMAWAVWKIQQRNKERQSSAEELCNTYVFSDTNTDSLEFDSPFTGNVKVILAAESETGIGTDVLAGRQGDFTASTDLLNDPQWIQYEADVIDLSVIVGATFNGIVGRFALDDAWYDIDMGETDTRYYLVPDGLDDYIELQGNLAPKAGDTIKIPFIAPTSQLAFASPIMSGVSNGIHLNFETTGVINYNSARVEVYLDGDLVVDDVTPYPTDGEHHELLIVGLGSGTINRFLTNNSLSAFASITIYDIDINIAAGTYFGNFFFPVDDGYTVAGTIRETSQGWDGTGYNITSDAWECK